jgi:hypothetical protein
VNTLPNTVFVSQPAQRHIGSAHTVKVKQDVPSIRSGTAESQSNSDLLVVPFKVSRSKHHVP